VAEKVRRMNSMLPEEFTVAPATEHKVRIKFAAELGAGLCQYPGKIGELPKGITKAGKVLPGNLLFAENSCLHDLQVVTADGSDEQGRAWRGILFVHVILDKIKEFPRFAPNLAEKLEVILVVVILKCGITTPVTFDTAVEQFNELFVPSHIAPPIELPDGFLSTMRNDDPGGIPVHGISDSSIIRR
jgi:hypothetical protein